MWQNAVDYLVFTLFALDSASYFAKALHFFIYDSVKIFFLMVFAITIITTIRTYIPSDRIKRYLEGKNIIFGVAGMALLGIITPFCSCSAIPLFIAFLRSKIPLALAFAFIISAPMNDEIVIITLASYFGWQSALLYTSTGLLVAMIGGILVGRIATKYGGINYDIWKNTDVKCCEIPKAKQGFSPQKPQTFSKLQSPKIATFSATNKTETSCCTPNTTTDDFETTKFTTFSSRILYSLGEAEIIIKNIFLYVLLGLAIGAIIHGYIPQSFIESSLGKENPFAIPMATLLGVPMYGSAIATVPTIIALIEKGASIGASFAFLMALSALSIPEALILKKIMSLKLLLTFFAIVATGVLINGYIIEWVLG